ncbi:2326_t:CDS:2, partial [Acaulospora colombiana]
FDQNGWQNPQHQVNECNEMYPHHLALSNIYGSVLESPFPTPSNLVTMETMQTTLSVSTPSYPLISLGESSGFNFAFNPRRPQNFMPYEPYYLQKTRANASQQTTRLPSSSPIGNQKPP